MKSDPETPSRAARPRRARKPRAEAGRSTNAAKSAGTADSRKSVPAAAGVESTTICSGSTPILPVSPQEPAPGDAPALARPQAPVPEFQWKWAGPPLAATGAFLATLAALLVGFWAGYGVGASSSGEGAITVAEAAETRPPVPPPIEIEPAPAKAEPQPARVAPPPQSGLHLQVSALRSRTAASDLGRRLENQGFPVRIEQRAPDSLVRVYVGPVAGAGELRAWIAELRKEGLEPFPKRL